MQFHVIDDDRQVSDVFTAMLQSMGFSARAFYCPRHYLEYVNSSSYEKPAVIVTDILMPGITGYELIEAIREVDPRQKFMVISATPDIRHPALYELCMFLGKPLRMETLAEAVKAIISCDEHGPSPHHECIKFNEPNALPADWKCPREESACGSA